MQKGKLPPEGPVTVVILYAAHYEDADRAPVSSSCHSSLSCRIYATTARGQQQTNEQDGREKAEKSSRLDKLQQPCPRAALGIIIEIPGRSGCVQIKVKYVSIASSS